jgi:hypothetical protein
MKNFNRSLLTTMVFLLSFSALIAQLQVSSTGGKTPVLPDSRAVLYQQIMENNDRSYASQDFETAYDNNDCQGIDDFIIPAATTWNIQTVSANGNGSITSNLANILIYGDVAGMPAAAATYSLMGLSCINSTGRLFISIPGGLQLGTGHYWISIQDASPYNSDGQWFWNSLYVIRNAESCWRNPGNGFGTGAINWTRISALGYPNSDFSFWLEGTIANVTPTCNYRIDLYDHFGDGWNGCCLDVLVNGNVVLDNITLASGYGPDSYYFAIPGTGVITTTFASGGWPYECYYYIYNIEGAQVWLSDGYGTLSPPPNIMNGQLNATCPTLGSIQGHIYNYDGFTISGAAVAKDAGPMTISDADGYYLLEGVTDGEFTIACTKTGFNPSLDKVNVIANDTVFHDFMLVEPEMKIYPEDISEVLLKNDMSTVDLTIINNGHGYLGWKAAISASGDDWLTMDDYAYTVVLPGFGSSITLPVHLDANLAGPGGGLIGKTYNADIVFTSVPDVGTIAIPVTLTIADPDMAPVPDLNYFYLDAEDGKIMLKWATPPGRSYLRYIVFRNGQSIDTTTSNFYIDNLENPGRFCYKVCSLSSDGFVSAPTEPVCLYYPFPPMVPVSNWALLLAGLLIGVYAFVMIRRR